MRKIRNFNLRLPFKEIRLKARRQLDLESSGFDDMKLQVFIEGFQKKLRPAVIYESFGPDSEATAALAPIPGLGHTLALATLGPDIGPLVDEQATESAERGKLAGLISRTALERTVKFVTGLLADEVEAEECELSPIHHLTENDGIRTVLDTLEGSKIGLSLEGGRLSPDHSTAFCLSWIARKRRGKKTKPRAAGRRR